MTDNSDPSVEPLGETENYVAWLSHETDPDDDVIHLELGSVTLHFFREEWKELLALIDLARPAAGE